ncbi:MAG TPA: prolyl oligopeptidase family serine peptidase, partial [Candidatus Dormibacteraeota bacterium]|nr:prolyl oligopeptidase family serine peptidase [Candidatus Dormibacteraeota bacterium]
RIELPFTAMRQLVSAGDRVVMLAGGPQHPRSVVSVDIRSGAFEVLRTSAGPSFDGDRRSEMRPVSFPGHGGATSHAFFYPPASADEQALPGELPPLIVRAHGGPTSATDTSLSETVQYWTSRGFAYVDVNYGGSAGYGREYRRRLNGMEGVVDVEDCIAAGRYLAELGLVDGSRMTVTGGSAGGYIVLCAMTYHDVFAAGAAHYGIADWETLVAHTHKFEERYFVSMLGPYPERRDLYYERSPIHFIERVRKPLILFQGLDDPVVPPEQSQSMYDAVRARGVPTAYIAFEGEQHGFRQSANIRRALEAELAFYCRVLGIEPAEQLPPIDIANDDKL